MQRHYYTGHDTSAGYFYISYTCVLCCPAASMSVHVTDVGKVDLRTLIEEDLMALQYIKHSLLSRLFRAVLPAVVVKALQPNESAICRQSTVCCGVAVLFMWPLLSCIPSLSMHGKIE